MRPLVLPARDLRPLLDAGVECPSCGPCPCSQCRRCSGGTIAVTARAAHRLHGSVLRTVDLVGIGACLLGLVLVAASAGTDPPADVSVAAYVLLAVVAVVLVAATVWLWRGGRAWPLAVVAGLGFGGTSLVVRAVHLPSGAEPLVPGLLAQPVPYLLVVFWTVGLISYSRALTVGAVSRVTAVFLVTEVIVPGLVGIALLGDSVRDGWWVPMTVGLLLAVAGVVVLAGSPAQGAPRPRRVR